MALTDAQKVKVRRYLGYSAVFSSQRDYLSTVFINMSDAVTDEVVDILDAIAEIDANLASTSGAQAGIIQVEEVRWDPGSKLSTAMADRARLITELANLLGVQIMNGSGGGPMMRG